MSSVLLNEGGSPGSERSESVPQKGTSPLSVGRQFALIGTLATYSTLLVVGITHHEPWADEAQAWLLSRDLGYRYLIFHQIAYEGHPPLWFTILWIANHWFHPPYQSIGWIGGICALAGCWFFCRYSPFPLWIRVLFPFTYFMAFQYAIVARPYVLFPLFAFMAAYFFADANCRPWRFIAALSALALLSATGVMLASGLMAARAWYAVRSWRQISPDARKQMLLAAVVFCLILAFVAWVNWPPSDRSFARFDRPANENSGLPNLSRETSLAFFGSTIPSVVFLLVVGVWCASRRCFPPFVLSTALVLLFFFKVYANLWHSGALTITMITALWIAWPGEDNAGKRPILESALYALVLLGLSCLFAVQIYWTARTLAMDYTRPYSGSRDAANFLHLVGADVTSTCGIGFHALAIQPYFRENIYQNWPKGEAFWRLENGNRNDQMCSHPLWVVLPRCCTFDPAKQRFDGQDRILRSLGYKPVHVSEGSLFFEGREVEPTDFVIYQLRTQ